MDHLKYLKGQLNISVAKALKLIEGSNDSNNSEINTPITVHNLSDRNTNTISQLQIQNVSVNANRCSLSILDPMIQFYNEIPVLLNGSNNLKEKKKLIEIINTCPFDSITSIYACLYFEYAHYRKLFDSINSSNFCALIQSLYQQKRFYAASEEIRYKIFKNVFINTEGYIDSENFLLIDAKTTLSFMISCICSSNNELASKKETSKCLSCGNPDVLFSPYLQILTYDLCNVENTIETEPKLHCRKCSKLIASNQIEIEYKNVIAIDTEEDGTLYAERRQRFSINDVPKQIQ